MDDPVTLPTESLFDLTGMSVADAKDYISSLAAHLKQTESDLKSVQDEAALWEGRVALADQRGLADLKAQAEAKRSDTVQKKTALELEISEFRDGIEKMKKQLAVLPMTQRTVDTNALLENLAHLGGPLDQVTPVTRRAEADEALAALKKKMSEGQ